MLQGFQLMKIEWIDQQTCMQSLHCNNTAHHVIFRTFSPRNRFAIIAAMNGAVANKSIAFATDVV